MKKINTKYTDRNKLEQLIKEGSSRTECARLLHIRLSAIDNTAKQLESSVQLQLKQNGINNLKHLGAENGFFNKKHNEETKEKIRNSKYHTNLCGEKNPNWHGGKYYEEYSFAFNNKLKNKIRNKYNGICLFCGRKKASLGYSLCIHHIDYNKKNCNEENLVPLCRWCHGLTNTKRNMWEQYYKTKVKIWEGIRCGIPAQL
jgi:hypothetical protein